jgi:hypothetical protein
MPCNRKGKEILDDARVSLEWRSIKLFFMDLWTTTRLVFYILATCFTSGHAALAWSHIVTAKMRAFAVIAGFVNIASLLVVSMS